MERGSLSLLSGKSTAALPKDFHGLCFQDSGVHGGQWPTPPTRIQEFHDYAPLQAAEVYNMRKMAYDKIIPSGFQPSPYNLASQNIFNQYINQQGVHPHHHHHAKSSSRPSLHHGIGRAYLSQMAPQYCCAPMATSEQCSRSRQQSLQREIGEKAPSSAPDSSSGPFSHWSTARQQAPSSQLTMFYRGAVLVYDDVSLHQAKEIMMVANNRPKLGSSSFAKPGLVAAAAIEQPVQAFKDPVPTDAPEIQQRMSRQTSCSDDDSAGVSLTLTIGSQSMSHENDMVMLNTSRPSSSSAAQFKAVDYSTVESGSSSAHMPRAIPQARKASIARFLEKRKDRLINCMPFAYSGKK